MGSTADRITLHLAPRGLVFSPLSPDELGPLQQQWRTIYAAELFARTGTWTWRGFDWHVFSYGYRPALVYERAADAYQTIGACDHMLLSSGAHESFGFACTGVPCDLTGLYRDVTVTACDFSWTMCFTHEPDCGPYFARSGEPGAADGRGAHASTGNDRTARRKRRSRRRG